MVDNQSFITVKDTISSALIDVTRTAAQISNEDLAFHRSTDPSIGPLLETQSSRLLTIARGLLNVATSGSETPLPHVSDVESVEDNWRGIVDVFDGLLENADESLDEYTGVIKRLDPAQEEKIRKATITEGRLRPARSYHSENIAKPQLLFVNVPRNDEKAPFKPLLRSKPHAFISLEESLTLFATDNGLKQYKHPYETEIREARYPPFARVISDPISYLPYESTKATWVDTPEAVVEMMRELKQAKEIAVDLEHHDKHSYIGLVSLMQISTRNHDWVVDTLRPWREDLQLLNEVFANPEIIKVFHGAFMDMIWLQRDLGLYVVGLFDTYHASVALGYPKHSLAYLLKRFADFDAAKKYQMADWRIRPIPEEMFNYARSDTHFLLYIYDNMRNELIHSSTSLETEELLIDTVMQNSKEESLQRYERPLYDEKRGSGSMGWYHMLCRTPALFNRQQFAVFRAIHQWRDMIARQEDESVHETMPKHVLYNIARETPTDMPSLLGCSHPISKPLLKRKGELLGVVKQAKDRAVTEPEMKDVMQEIGPRYHKDVMHGSRQAAAVATKGGQSLDSALPVRSNTSRFWGPTVSGSAASHRTCKNRDSTEGVRLAVPLPQLTAEVFVDRTAHNSVGDSLAHHEPGARAEHRYVKDRMPKTDENFVIGQDSGSRKRKVSATGPGFEPTLPETNDKQPSDEMTINLEDDEAIRQAELRRKKRERKLERKRQTQQTLSLVDSNGKSIHEEPAKAFDYVNAPSILHAKNNENNRKPGNTFINPYTKSLDAPKSMRRPRTENVGKSHTFKD